MATGETAVRLAGARPTAGRKALIRALEISIGAIITLLVLQLALDFNLTDPSFWALYGSVFVRGILGTLGYLALIMPLSVAIGFVLGWGRLSPHRVVSWPISVYINFFRGIPLLLIVIFAAILLPALLGPGFGGTTISLTLAAIAVALHSAAFQAEIFRAGFQSVPRGQVEAAEAIGLRSTQAMRHVILPQALRLSLPPLGNELAVVIKDTSLLAVVGALELFGRSYDFTQTIILTPGTSIYWMLSAWTAVAIVYLVMTVATTELLSWLERRYHVRGLEGLSV